MKSNFELTKVLKRGFNYELENLKTAEDVEISYLPYDNTEFTYIIYKDDKIIEEKTSSTNKITTNLSKSGKYKIVAKRFVNGKEVIEKTEEIIIDKEAPVIKFKQESISIDVGESIDPLMYITVNDNIDGNLINKVTTNIKNLKIYEKGEKVLTYTVSDEVGNETTRNIKVSTGMANETSIIVAQIILGFVLILLVLLLFRYKNYVQKEKRISRYAVKKFKGNHVALFDIIIEKFVNIKNLLIKVIKKNKILSKYPIINYKGIEMSGLNLTREEIIAQKIMTGIVFILIGIVSKTLQSNYLEITEMINVFIIANLLSDAYYILKRMVIKSKLENDLLQAITIMNNSFKSGKSIIQAVEIVSEELHGTIADEFGKIHTELSLGLDISVAFTRFAERVQLDEATYLTSSLTILNSTGGNIIKIFDSIETSLFNKKKIKLEMDALTASSKIVLLILLIVPILFVTSIMLIEPTYFQPFFNSTIGLIYLTIISVIYVVYFVVLNKLMKVRL